MYSDKDFIKTFKSASFTIIQNAIKNMEKACLVVERDAKINCPIDQGQLRSSISHNVNFNDNKIIGTIFSNLEYAPYVHQGTGIYAIDGKGRKTPWKYEVLAGKYKGFHITKGQKPQPFLQKARDSNKDKIAKILGD